MGSELRKKQIIPTAKYGKVFVDDGEEGEPKLLTSHRAIIDDLNPDHVYSLMTKDYRIVQHEEQLAMFDEVVKSNPEFGAAQRAISLLNDGGKMEVKYRFPEVKMEIAEGDIVNPELIGRNSYDGGWRFTTMLGGYRVVCSNGLVVGKTIYMIKQFHYENLKIENIRVELDEAMHKFSIQTKLWESWVDRVTKYEEYEQVINDMKLGQKEAEIVQEELNNPKNTVNGKLTMWLFYNIITALITHHSRSQAKRIAMEDRARRAFDRLK